MHKLHTTFAFVLHSFPQGESNRVYRLLTRDFGLLYAHAQGVRELKSRNKYALKIGQFTEVTLVKGKVTWRITGAQNKYKKFYLNNNYINRKKIFNLITKFLPVEDDSKEIFDVLCGGDDAFYKYGDKYADLIELIIVLRLLDKLGFLSRPFKETFILNFLNSYSISLNLLEKANQNEKVLLIKVNNSLNEAL